MSLLINDIDIYSSALSCCLLVKHQRCILSVKSVSATRHGHVRYTSQSVGVTRHVRYTSEELLQVSQVAFITDVTNSLVRHCDDSCNSRMVPQTNDSTKLIYTKLPILLTGKGKVDVGTLCQFSDEQLPQVMRKTSCLFQSLHYFACRNQTLLSAVAGRPRDVSTHSSHSKFTHTFALRISQ